MLWQNHRRYKDKRSPVCRLPVPTSRGRGNIHQQHRLVATAFNARSATRGIGSGLAVELIIISGILQAGIDISLSEITQRLPHPPGSLRALAEFGCDNHLLYFYARAGDAPPFNGFARVTNSTVTVESDSKDLAGERTGGKRDGDGAVADIGFSPHFRRATERTSETFAPARWR